MKVLNIAMVLAFSSIGLQAKLISIRDVIKTYSEDEAVTAVDLRGKKINDWEGIDLLRKKFPNMKTLNLSNNYLPAIHQAIQDIGSLDYLDLSDNNMHLAVCDAYILGSVADQIKSLNVEKNKINAAVEWILNSYFKEACIR